MLTHKKRTLDAEELLLAVIAWGIAIWGFKNADLLITTGGYLRDAIKFVLLTGAALSLIPICMSILKATGVNRARLRRVLATALPIIFSVIFFTVLFPTFTRLQEFSNDANFNIKNYIGRMEINDIPGKWSLINSGNMGCNELAIQNYDLLPKWLRSGSPIVVNEINVEVLSDAFPYFAFSKDEFRTIIEEKTPSPDIPMFVNQQVSIIEESKIISSSSIKKPPINRMDFDFDSILCNYSQNTEAIDQLKRGYTSYVKYSETGLLDAISHFKEAIRYDSTFLIAYTALADAYLQMWFRGWRKGSEALSNADTNITLATVYAKSRKSIAYYRSSALNEIIKAQDNLERLTIDNNADNNSPRASRDILAVVEVH